MKKALQIRHLRAELSVSDGAVARRPCERRFYGFRDGFAQLWIHDPRGQLSRLSRLLRRRLHRCRRSRSGDRLRQRSGREAKPRAARQPVRDLARPLGQLEPPDRIAYVDNERPVGLRSRRPGVARDLLADGGGPLRDRVSGPAIGTDAAQLGPDLVSDGLHYAIASRTLPGFTSSSWSGAAGSIAASVAVMSA